MRCVCLIAILSLCLATECLAQSFEASITDSLCNCFSALPSSAAAEERSALYQTTCLRRILEKHKESIEKSLDTIPGTEGEKNAAMGNRLIANLSRLMVSGCDPFYEFFSNYRNFFFEKADLEEERRNIVSRTESINGSPTVADYFERGLSHYLLKDFTLAELDFKKVLQLNPDHTEAHLFRGYIHEQRGKYRDAINEYRIVKKTGAVRDIDLIMAIAERELSDAK